MKQQIKDYLRNYPLIQRILAVAFTLFVIILFLPKQSLFKFEYQVNQPWQHERLLAPFDFSIQKTDDQLESERVEIKADQAPVFRFEEPASLDTNIINELSIELTSGYTNDTAAADSLLKKNVAIINSLLEDGILRSSENLKGLNPLSNILIFRDGTLKTTRLKEVRNLQNVIDSLISVNSSDSLGKQFVELIIPRLRSNLIYNDSITQKLVNAELNQILQVEGKINKGQAIIDKGDIVDEFKIRTLSSLEQELEKRNVMNQGFSWSIIGEIGLIVTLLVMLSVYITLNLPSIHNDPRPVTLSMVLIGISFAASSLAMHSTSISIYVIPIGIMPLLLRVFYDFRISIFSFVVLTLLIALFYPNAIEFAVTQISAISLATLYQASSTKRSRILNTALLVFLGYSLIYTFIALAQNGNLQSIETINYGWFAINALLCTLVFPLVYLVEKLFGYISETTLLELGESNQPLLKELAIKAPGTFQHSLQVANLAEKVANSIGGDAILLRTAAMYHDVGKMNEPQFFIENQLPDQNPHDELEPEESARIIINHVSKGVEFCKRKNIPTQIIQFIRTHHGTSRVRYFHQLAQKASAEPVDVSKFTYPGPKPFTKETAILMMADSIEAASRSLKHTDAKTLDSLVENIINNQEAEGQFQEAPITFLEIQEAKRTLKAALRSIYHQRISYD